MFRFETQDETLLGLSVKLSDGLKELEKELRIGAIIDKSSLRLVSSESTGPIDLGGRAGPTVPHNPPPSANALMDSTGSNVVERDAKGLPWDERIHSSAKSKNMDGSWKKKKGVDDVTLAKVEAELRGVATTVQAPLAPPPAVTTPVAGPVIPQPQTAPPGPVAPPPLPAPTNNYDNVTIPPVNKPAHSLSTFSANMAMIIAQFVTEGKLTQETITQLCNNFQVKQIWDLSQNAGAIESIFKWLVNDVQLITNVG